MFAKRVLDLLISIPLLIILSPLWLMIVLWIKADSEGPAVFRQERVGRNGALFTIYKFRTMVPNADAVMKEKIELLKKEGKFDPDNFIFQDKDDPRITKSGRFLRKSSLDELPQLLNIINGTMSIVGPRPEVPEIVDQYTPEQRHRLDMPPGVTGLAQVNGRSELTLTETLNYDVEYVQNWRFGLDLKILWKTLFIVLKGKGAY
ncbi:MULTISPECIES: sugar transferase [unclassified Dehalobacter]|uniref:sugar transferase n=1 Tax=unclassified Dehalobacter TaxID=2635733 RepID=UPI00028B3108|nr:MULTISPECIES: sugar transferase [unclassified Dehalobacter]AFV03701.1 Undecaprenyl-phosphate galactosephosphotransferase [Dehalobacter sp. DCA]AFV06688.1 Undecaprenyl-phosphate galactosephosphotransferase [Dehalobacter sp. CF]